MRTTKNLIAALAGGIGGLALVALAPIPAGGQETQECNGDITLTYVNPVIVQPPATVRVKITITADEIIGGAIQPPRIVFPAVHFFQDCIPLPNMLAPSSCMDAGDIVSYNGDATITTTCRADPTMALPLVTWASNIPAGGPLPNTITFTPTPLVQSIFSIGATQGPCDLEFEVTVTKFPQFGICLPVATPPGPTVCNFQPGSCQMGQTCVGVIPEIADYLPFALCTNLLTSGAFQTAAIGVIPPEDQPPYNCYETRRGSLTSKKTVSIADVFGNGSLTMAQLKRFCAPANKNDEHPEFILLPGHLAGYPFTNVTGTFQKPNGVTVNTQFGTYTVNVRNPKRLLVPSAKSKLGPPPVNPLPPGTIRHFLCHDVDNVSGPKPAGTSAEDQFFALTLNTASLGASTLCAPANKNNEDPAALGDTNFLFCIDSKTTTAFPDTNLFFNNQFGPSNQQFTNPPPFFESLDELCLPATIQIP